MPVFYMIVALGGALGAIARYTVVMLSQYYCDAQFPYGTVIVNTAGCFLAGFFLVLLAGRFNADQHVRLFFFTGFLGAFTTFSSFAAESLAMYEQAQWHKLGANILINNLGSMTMVLLGSILARYCVLHYFNRL